MDQNSRHQIFASMCPICLISWMRMIMKPVMFLNGRKFKIVQIMSEREIEKDSSFVYKVILGRQKWDNEYVLKKILCQTEERYLEAMIELKIMSEMNKKSSSPYILKLADSCTTINRRNQKEVYLLTSPYICSMQNVIDHGSAVYSDACPSLGYPHCPFYDGLDAVMILRQCCEGLEALHSYGYRHGDLHPGNILLRANLQAVLSDFSNVAAIPQQLKSRADALAVEERAAQRTRASYRAPELFATPGEFLLDGRSDVWSFGCTMYAVLFSRNPFFDSIAQFSKLSAMSGQFSFPPNGDNPWPQDYLETVSACLQVHALQVHAQQRPTVGELKLRLRRLSAPPLDLSQRECPRPVGVGSRAELLESMALPLEVAVAGDECCFEEGDCEYKSCSDDFTMMEIPPPSPRSDTVPEQSDLGGVAHEQDPPVVGLEIGPKFFQLTRSSLDGEGALISGKSSSTTLKSEYAMMLEDGERHQAIVTLRPSNLTVSRVYDGRSWIFSLHRPIKIDAVASQTKGSYLAIISGSCTVPGCPPENEGEISDWETVEHVDVIPIGTAESSCKHPPGDPVAKHESAVYVLVEECVDTQCQVDFGSFECMADWIDAVNNQEDQQLHDYV